MQKAADEENSGCPLEARPQIHLAFRLGGQKDDRLAYIIMKLDQASV
jgi:hypothetical protein